jgi:hypothetical protein
MHCGLQYKKMLKRSRNFMVKITFFMGISSKHYTLCGRTNKNLINLYFIEAHRSVCPSHVGLEGNEIVDKHDMRN